MGELGAGGNGRRVVEKNGRRVVGKNGKRVVGKDGRRVLEKDWSTRFWHHFLLGWK